MLAFGKVFAKEIRSTFQFRSCLNADPRVFYSTMFARPVQRSSSLLMEFSLFPSPNDARERLIFLYVQSISMYIAGHDHRALASLGGSRCQRTTNFYV